MSSLHRRKNLNTAYHYNASGTIRGDPSACSKKEQVTAIASVQVVLSLPEIEPTEDEKLGLGGMLGT